jgi:predicted dehydrogenase
MMLKIGVLGAGHLGKIHIKCIQLIAQYELVGFYDPDPDTVAQVEKELGVHCFASVEDLIEAVDVVDIVTPTVQHFHCASMALRRRRHVFIEKPVVATPEEAVKLIDLADAAGVKVQVGHVERFNPAFIAAEPFITSPMFIEAHRLSMFNPRGTDVPVVLDLMVHDLDILLTIVRSTVTHVSASGIPVVCKTPDITNARIEFENGAVANLTASRISLKNMRKMRIFQDNAYITVDFLDKKTEVMRIHDEEQTGYPYSMMLDLADGNTRQITLERPEIHPLNAIQTELESFYSSIIHNTTPVVTIEDGVKVLNLAYDILKAVDESIKKMAH